MTTTGHFTFEEGQNHSKSMRQFLIFSQERSRFAIDLVSVREVLVLGEKTISPVPNTLSFLLGLINLRGEILAVADFGRFTGNSPIKRQGGKSRILIVESPDPEDVKSPRIQMGIAVDVVEGVSFLNRDKIVSAEEVTEELAPFLCGLYDHQGRPLMIIDIEAITQSDRW